MIVPNSTVQYKKSFIFQLNQYGKVFASNTLLKSFLEV